MSSIESARSRKAEGIARILWQVGCTAGTARALDEEGRSLAVAAWREATNRDPWADPTASGETWDLVYLLLEHRERAL